MILAFKCLVNWDIAKLESHLQIPWQNLSREEKRALDSLTLDKNLIIREADKGGAIVLIDCDIYIGETLKQLNNEDFYKEIPEDPSKPISNLIQTVVLEGSNLGYINEFTAKSLLKQDYRIPIFYILPKIHKLGFPHPGHPIISGCNSLLDPLSKYLDFFLQPLVSLTPSYLKDT